MDNFILGTKFAIAWTVCKPIIQALLIVIVGAIFIGFVLKVVQRALNKTSIDEALHTFIKNIIKVLLWLIVIITALGKLGVPTTTFVTVVGACGAAIALALKDNLSNISGGILIIIKKPFGKGDFIEVAGTSGVVDKIDLFTTILKTGDNKVISVPNSSITTGVLVNYSREELRRVDCTFGIGYECSIAQAKDVISAVIERNDLILSNPQKLIVVGSQGDNSVNLECRVWCKNEDYWTVKFFLEENVKLAFDEANISIPYPQMDVHLIK